MKHLQLCAAIIAGGAALTLGTTAQAVIIHEGQEGIAAIQPAPHDAIVGTWNKQNTRSSAVAIDPYFFLASNHQFDAGATNMDVATFGGQTYSVVNSWQIGNADLRLVQIDTTGPALQHYASITQNVVSGQNPYAGQTFTFGGWGVTRGSVIDEGGESGYSWGSVSSQMVWGHNTVNSGLINLSGTRSLSANFLHYNDPNAVLGEAIAGGGDSGGGWFVQDGNGDWSLIGISIAVSTGQKSLWDPSDTMYAAFVGYQPYHNQIMSIIPEPASLALLGSGLVLLIARRRRDSHASV